MPGINIMARNAERQVAAFSWLTGFTIVPTTDYVSVLTGESTPRVELYAPATAFRQPKGKKHAPKDPSTKVLNDRAWKASKFTRFECGCGICLSCDPTEWSTKPRSAIEREVISEEMEHARQLSDLEAIAEDGFGTNSIESYETVASREGMVDGSYITCTPSTTPSTTEATEEARMMNSKSTATNRNGSLARPMPSGRRTSKGLPWRTDCRIEPRSLTITPDPEAKARTEEDAKYLAMRPVDPATRKAAPVAPEGMWTLDDLIDDIRLVRNGA